MIFAKGEKVYYADLQANTILEGVVSTYDVVGNLYFVDCENYRGRSIVLGPDVMFKTSQAAYSYIYEPTYAALKN